MNTKHDLPDRTAREPRVNDHQLDCRIKAHELTGEGKSMSQKVNFDLRDARTRIAELEAENARLVDEVQTAKKA